MFFGLLAKRSVAVYAVVMDRRRLVLAAALAVAALGAAWWLLSDGLSAEERRLVGTWSFGSRSGTGSSVWRFGPDRRCYYGRPVPGGGFNLIEWSGRWSAQDGEVVLDGEASALRRAVRPIVRVVGLYHTGTITYRLESVTADEVVLVTPGGREVWKPLADE